MLIGAFQLDYVLLVLKWGVGYNQYADARTRTKLSIMRGTTLSGPVRMTLLVQLSVVDLYLCIIMSGLVVSS